MFSWFPIYFPLKEPLALAPGAPVVAHMWRRCVDELRDLHFGDYKQAGMFVCVSHMRRCRALKV